MNRTCKHLFAMVVVGLISMVPASVVHATVVTLDNTNGGGYVPASTDLYYAYNTGASAGGGSDLAATMQGITFLPWNYPATTPPSTPANPAGVSNALITVSGNGAFQPVPPLALGGSEATALRELLRGGFYSTGLTLTLGGLNVNQRYQVDVFVESNGDARVENFTFTGATAPTDFFTTDGSHAYDVRERLLPDAGGNIVVTLPNTGDNPFLNAFSVTLVPEPASLGLLSAGGLLLMRRRSR